MSLLDINDFVICRENNDYKCSGYKINNSHLKNEQSPLITNNSNNKNINNVSNISELFNNTAFPMGLLYNNYDDKHYLEPNIKDDDGVIPDDLYDKLIKFSKQNNEPKKPNKTKKKVNKKIKKKNKTKKK
jgi:hypothetical protein|tara:strand:+ start:275 stop:664 length:390 start_codon:yes stop_codon:yes gene_type:complete